ncbi:statherin [Camelus ferus]|uniref:Statherin n=1 Tax=Camelus ferus TaxID=419612 RepID=A0A8B8R9N9_CAMFR|nr:statherin [Camelus ferus]
MLFIVGQMKKDKQEEEEEMKEERDWDFPAIISPSILIHRTLPNMKILLFAFIMALMLAMIGADTSEEEHFHRRRFLRGSPICQDPDIQQYEPIPIYPQPQDPFPSGAHQ